MKRKAGIDRRQALRAAAAFGALGSMAGRPWALGGPRLLAADPDAEREGDGAVLVLVQLSGGNDGLSTVVPYADDAYHAARSTTRIDQDEVLPLDDYVGLHPALGGLRGLYDEGRIAIVQGCGYPRPNRSHFKSMEIWHSADLRGRAAGQGWVGRLCTAAFGDRTEASRLVHIGGTVPFSLYSPVHGASSFVVPEGYRWIGKEDEVAGYDADERRKPSGKSRLDFLRGVLSDARESSKAIRTAAASYRPKVDYPDDSFGLDLRAAAALVRGDVGARVLSVELRGFDTHSSQRSPHNTLMRRLDHGLSAFLRDLGSGEETRDVVVLAFSEFGRRVQENGSRGTDHGAAGPMFVAGTRVRGGLHGAHPSLVELEGGDLVHTTDFRAVYGAAIEACFGVRTADVLGAGTKPLDLFS
ncbi:MAG: DUF1501 domain-containing protein [Planctomycetota bacterium]